MKQLLRMVLLVPVLFLAGCTVATSSYQPVRSAYVVSAGQSSPYYYGGAGYFTPWYSHNYRGYYASRYAYSRAYYGGQYNRGYRYGYRR